MTNDSDRNVEREGERASQHPVELLIREIIRTRRTATNEEIEQIIERMAAVPFNPDRVGVPQKHRGLRYRGRVVRPARTLYSCISSSGCCLKNNGERAQVRRNISAICDPQFLTLTLGSLSIIVAAVRLPEFS